jgi:hypothetical protein
LIISMHDMFSNLYKCNCMNDGSNTEEKYHEDGCQYVNWLHLQYTMNREDLNSNEEKKDDTR